MREEMLTGRRRVEDRRENNNYGAERGLGGKRVDRRKGGWVERRAATVHDPDQPWPIECK